MILTVVRLSRVRYLALTIPPFAVGTIGSPDYDGTYLMIGIAAIVLLRAISSIGNCISDRLEDALDHPQRVILCQRVGYDRLRIIVNCLILTYLVLLVIMVTTCDVHPAALLLWGCFLLIKWSYSFGPRLKPRRFSATILLGGVSGGMFFVGWIGGGISEMAVPLMGGILLWAMGASLIGSKDAPNLEGDQAAGYRSVYRDLIESGRPFLRASRSLSRPYVLSVALALLTVPEYPGWKILWCWLAYPLAMMLGWAMTHARTIDDRSLVREFGYLYWIVFMGVVLVSLVPGAASLAVVAGGLGWFLVTSRILHPDPTQSVPQLWRGLRQSLA